jgi:subtilisin family serine protease
MTKAIVNGYLNIRTENPTINVFNNPGYYKPGDIIEISEKVLGQTHKGNNIWYKLSNGGYVWSERVSKSEDLAAIAVHSKSSLFTKWGIDRLWESTNGKNMKIGLIDTGIRADHLSLKFSNVSVVEGLETTLTESFHGTYMAAIIAGSDTKNGYVGVAPGVELKFCAMGSINNLSSKKLANCIKQLEDVDVISMSFATRHDSFKPKEKDAKDLISLINQFTLKKNIIFVAASGNKGPHGGIQFYPAAYENVISVSGHNENDQSLVDDDATIWDGVTLISSFGNYFDQAPSVVTDFSANDLVEFKGSSPACAFTAGLITLIQSQAQSQNGQKLTKAELINTCFDTVTVKSNKTIDRFQTHMLNDKKIKSRFKL